MNTYLCVAVNLKCMLMRLYHINKIIKNISEAGTLLTTSVYLVFL